MRNILMVMAVFGAVCFAMGQAVTRWQRLYSVSGYMALFAAAQYDGADTLYALVSLRQPEGEDGVSLVRYTLRGGLVDARPHGLSNRAQEEGFDLQPLPNGGCVIICALSEPIWDQGTVLSEQTTLVYYPPTGPPTLERRAYGLPVALVRGNNRLFIATQAGNGHTAYLNFDLSTLTYRETAIFVRYGAPLDIAWETSQGVVLGGWGGTSSGRTGFYWSNNALNYLNTPFSYVSQVQPLPNGNIVYLWGSGDQNEAHMYGPDGLQAERLTLQAATSGSGEAFVYVMAQQEVAFTLVRINDATLSRQWELPLSGFNVGLWTVDPSGNVYLYGLGNDGREFRKIRADGSLAWRLPVQHIPLPQPLKSLIPLPNGSILVAGDTVLTDGALGVMVTLIGRRGDTNGDGCVDDADLISVLSSFGGDTFVADLNADGVVDDADLLEVLFALGTGC